MFKIDTGIILLICISIILLILSVMKSNKSDEKSENTKTNRKESDNIKETENSIIDVNDEIKVEKCDINTPNRDINMLDKDIFTPKIIKEEPRIEPRESRIESKTDHGPIYIYNENFIESSIYNSGKSFKGEESVKAIFEELFYPHKFYTVRPIFLTNPYTNRTTEIDMMCAINIGNGYIFVGCDYHGEQHLKFVPYFHESDKDYEKQVMRDRWKFDKCKRMGIPVLELYHNVENKRQYILDWLKLYPSLSKHYKHE